MAAHQTFECPKTPVRSTTSTTPRLPSIPWDRMTYWQDAQRSPTLDTKGGQPKFAIHQNIRNLKDNDSSFDGLTCHHDALLAQIALGTKRRYSNLDRNLLRKKLRRITSDYESGQHAATYANVGSAGPPLSVTRPTYPDVCASPLPKRLFKDVRTRPTLRRDGGDEQDDPFV